MITELYLENWKSFAKATLYIDPLTFLIGTNASGKSNVLDAFMFLQRLASGISTQTAINGDMSISPLRGGVEWLIRDGENHCVLRIKVQSVTYSYIYELEFLKAESDIVITSERLLLDDASLSESRVLFYTGMADERVSDVSVYICASEDSEPVKFDFVKSHIVLWQVDKSGVNKEVKEGAAAVIKALQDIFILDPIPNHMRGYSKLSDKLLPDASNIAGVLAALEDEKRLAIEEKLTKYLRPLPEKDIDQVFVERVGRHGTDAMLYCKEEWVKGKTIEVDAREMSDGTLRFLAIITAILLGKKSSLLIVEEIDNGLHPSRAVVLARMLEELSAEKEIDILCTTHNPELINALGNKMIPFISSVKRNDDDGSSEIALIEDLENLPRLVASYPIGDLMTKNKL